MNEIKKSKDSAIDGRNDARSSIKVYLADDDEDDQYLVKRAFNQVGRNPDLIFFNDGVDLIDALEDVCMETDKLPCLVMLDLNMPNLNGKDTLMKIRGSEKLKHLPVIIYTTSHAVYDIEEMYRLGANAYIVKEGKFTDMVTSIEKLSDFWFDVAELGSGQ